jgi:hypothetical protein
MGWCGTAHLRESVVGGCDGDLPPLSHLLKDARDGVGRLLWAQEEIDVRLEVADRKLLAVQIHLASGGREGEGGWASLY